MMATHKRLRAALLFVFGIVLGSALTLLFAKNPALLTGKPSLDGTLAGAVPEREKTVTLKAPVGFQRLLEAYQVIESNYYDPEAADASKLIDGAIRGMVDALGDPYTSYMDPEELKEFQTSLSSSFEGIGTEVTMQNNRLTVVSPFKDSPAEKAGIRPNDQIITVDGQSIEGLSLHEAVKKIRGPKGSKVELGILRNGLSEPITITVIRDKIPLESVYSSRFQKDGHTIGRLQITSFSENTDERFKAALKNLQAEGIEGLIIDVRGNPGGYLGAVDHILNTILPNGKIMYQIEYRDGHREVAKSNGQGLGIPVVVLIDEGSASASEILAAGLKDAGFPIVGTKSFGKGTVQVPKDLSSGGTLKLTTAKWLAPDGSWIHKVGVTPTVEVQEPAYFHLPPLAVEKPLGRDTNDKTIALMQQMLKALGFDPKRTDGYFDATTEQALRAFQSKEGLLTTGKLDDQTAQALNNSLVQKIKNPDNDRQLEKALQTVLKALQK